MQEHESITSDDLLDLSPDLQKEIQESADKFNQMVRAVILKRTVRPYDEFASQNLIYIGQIYKSYKENMEWDEWINWWWPAFVIINNRLMPPSLFGKKNGHSIYPDKYRDIPVFRKFVKVVYQTKVIVDRCAEESCRMRGEAFISPNKVNSKQMRCPGAEL